MVNGWAGSAVIYEGTVRHTRLTPFIYRLRHRTYHWLVDVDDLPRPPLLLRPLAGFHERDHIADSSVGIRTIVERFVSQSGEPVPGGRILMLTHARVLGHVFNPLTVYWLHDTDNRLRCAVAEVHNTYGESHHYLARLQSDGRALVDKEFYVSPFFAVDGEYDMRLPKPGHRLQLTVKLRHGAKTSFIATVTGRRRPVSTRSLLATAIRYPLSTFAVSAGIRWHGIRLYLRGLSVVPRTGKNLRKEAQ